MNRYKRLAIVSFSIAALFVASAVAFAQDAKKLDAFGVPVGSKNLIAHIHYSAGGHVNAYLMTAVSYKKNNIVLDIVGDCESACTIAVEFLHSIGGKVTFGENARFGYHMRKMPDGSHNIPPYYRKDIVDYVANNGGWREHGLPYVYVGVGKLNEWYN